MTIEEKLEHIMNSSIEDAKAQSEAMLSKYTSALDTEFEEYKHSVDTNAGQRLKAETNHIKMETNRELASKQIEIKRAISKKQSELKDKLFVEVKDKLATFMRTPDYMSMLERQIKAAKAFAGEDEIIIYVDPADEAIIPSLQMNTGLPISVSRYSFSGGTRAVIRAKNILIDNSFEKKLEEAYETFTFTGGKING